MQRIRIIAVGKLKEAWMRAGCAEYEKRIAAFARLDITELPEERLPESPNDAQIAAALSAEGAKMLRLIPPNAFTAALCIEGGTLPSEALADRLAKESLSGRSEAVFLIGSSHGLSDEVKRAANCRLSMSPMTFPHQLARLMLLEQLYRACQITAGGKYHK